MENLHPARQRGLGDHLGEYNLDPGFAPPADETHDLQGIQSEADEIIVVGKMGRREQIPYGFADGIVLDDRGLLDSHYPSFSLEYGVNENARKGPALPDEKQTASQTSRRTYRSSAMAESFRLSTLPTLVTGHASSRSSWSGYLKRATPFSSRKM